MEKQDMLGFPMNLLCMSR
ncbi:hypothetical protein Nmel_001422 [Mimus melanotis]